ncbi:hypothetical protein LP422_02400 [Janibacter limosus]|uniref:Uncharacterized protein n=1 Tax=Janibacter limosus TaxID=53458 RepID=A0AC61U555_9MICO|nr:hypothetical protein [Janibacter limosus]UUZ45157.1 hypothetical protein LP422_02400 [Janibacter limosus]
MPYDKSWKARIRNKMAPLRAKERRGTISPEEAELLANLRAQVERNGKRNPGLPRMVKSQGEVEGFDAAPGVRSVVSGGLPGQGRKR